MKLRKMEVILGIMVLWGVSAVADEASEYFTCAYGRVTDIDRDQIKGCQVQSIELFPCESENSDKKIMRNGLLVCYPTAQATIVLCHGFMCDMIDTAFLRTLFSEQAYNFITFNFRAHGTNTDGQICTFGRDEAQDVIAAGNFARNHPLLKDKPVFVYGFSMGAVSTIEAQAKDPLFDALILDCPFDTSENVLKQSIDRMKFSVCGYEFDMPGKCILQRHAFHPYVQTFLKAALKAVVHLDTKNIQTNLCPLTPVESVKKITAPCMFIHCKQDEKIPLDSIKNIFANAQGYKILYITNGRRHFDSFFYQPEQYRKKINKFLIKVIDKSYLEDPVDELTVEDYPEIVIENEYLKEGESNEANS